MNDMHNNTQFSIDDAYALMMDALDGTLTAAQTADLNHCLELYPELREEWQAMQAVDSLLQASPQVIPPTDFTERTVARLPNLAARRWALGTIFALVLLAGLLPVAAVVLLTGSVEGLVFMWQIGGVVAEAIGQLIINMGEAVGRQPAIMGTLFVMIGSIVLWSGVYRQLTAAPSQAMAA